MSVVEDNKKMNGLSEIDGCLEITVSKMIQ